MSTKKILTAGALFILFCTTSLKAQTVYIAETGKKYHTKNCEALKQGKKSISLKDAIKQGYEPCAGCKAEVIETSADKKKIKDSKK